MKISKAVLAVQKIEHAAIERACEESLTLGDRGVLVEREGSVFGRLVKVQASTAVPYGQIYVVATGDPEWH